jgi:hypothetical protein
MKSVDIRDNEETKRKGTNGKFHYLVCTDTGTGLLVARPTIDELFKMDSKCAFALRGADLTVIVEERLRWDGGREMAPVHEINTKSRIISNSYLCRGWRSLGGNQLQGSSNVKLNVRLIVWITFVLGEQLR